MAKIESWTRIASEGQSFILAEEKTVRYGSGTHWIEKKVKGAVSCTNDFFGADPISGTVKVCEQVGTGGVVLVDPPAPTAAAPAPLPAPGPVPAEVLPSLDAKMTAQDASRFLHQATFGATAEDIATLSQSSVNAWLEQQFNMPMVPIGPQIAALDDGRSNDEMRTLLHTFTWEQAVRGQDQLRQRARLALSQIIVASGQNAFLYNLPGMRGTFWDVLGRHTLGNYRELLQEVAIQPTLGYYLTYRGNDGAAGLLTRPDENFAREVMQLFTIGLVQLNPDGTPKRDANGRTIETYDQSTVIGLAKVFTGWNYQGKDPSDRSDSTWQGYNVSYDKELWQKPMVAYPKHHSAGSKTLLNGVVLPAGGTAESDMKATLDQLFNHPNVGPFVGKQLIQRMVTSNPSPAYVKRVAAAFDNNGKGVRGDLKAVFRAILVDPEARSAANAQSASFGRLREPLLRFGNMARATRMQAADGSFGRMPIGLVNSNDGLGQDILMAPSVFGFSRPGYAPKAIGDKGLVAPEFMDMNERTAINVSNSLYLMIHSADGVERFSGGFPKPSMARWAALADRPAALVDDLNLVFAAGSMADATQQLIGAAVQEIGTDRARWREERAQLALLLTMNAPEYLVQK